MKPQDVVVGMGVALAGDVSEVGTVLKRDGPLVRVDFRGKKQWREAAELQPSGGGVAAPASAAAGLPEGIPVKPEPEQEPEPEPEPGPEPEPEEQVTRAALYKTPFEEGSDSDDEQQEEPGQSVPTAEEARPPSAPAAPAPAPAPARAPAPAPANARGSVADIGASLNLNLQRTLQPSTPVTQEAGKQEKKKKKKKKKKKDQNTKAKKDSPGKAVRPGSISERSAGLDLNPMAMSPVARSKADKEKQQEKQRVKTKEMARDFTKGVVVAVLMSEILPDEKKLERGQVLLCEIAKKPDKDDRVQVKRAGTVIKGVKIHVKHLAVADSDQIAEFEDELKNEQKNASSSQNTKFMIGLLMGAAVGGVVAGPAAAYIVGAAAAAHGSTAAGVVIGKVSGVAGAAYVASLAGGAIYGASDEGDGRDFDDAMSTQALRCLDDLDEKGAPYVFVVALHNGLQHTFQNYAPFDQKRHIGCTYDCAVWKAARATSAAPGFFKAMQIELYDVEGSKCPDLSEKPCEKPPVVGDADIQLNGKGEFETFRLCLEGHSLQFHKLGDPAATPVLTVDVEKCTVRDPKTVRHDHEHAFRLNTVVEDAGGNTKYIISVPQEAERREWKESISKWAAARVQQREFKDGGIGHNNPVKLVFKEAERIWGDCPPQHRFLMSIGCGLWSDTGETGRHAGLRADAKLITECEQKHREVKADLEDFQDTYLRLNPDMTGNLTIRMDATCEKDLVALRSSAEKCLAENERELEQFCGNLMKSHGLLTRHVRRRGSDGAWVNPPREVTAERPLCLLSIDGGGTRGLVPSLIIEHIEKKCGCPVHELFDLVGGTSTGGIIALGTCVAKAPIKDMVSVYEHPKEIWANWRAFGPVVGDYDERPIERILKEKSLRPGFSAVSRPTVSEPGPEPEPEL